MLIQHLSNLKWCSLCIWATWNDIHPTVEQHKWSSTNLWATWNDVEQTFDQLENTHTFPLATSHGAEHSLEGPQMVHYTPLSYFRWWKSWAPHPWATPTDVRRTIVVLPVMLNPHLMQPQATHNALNTPLHNFQSSSTDTCATSNDCNAHLSSSRRGEQKLEHLPVVRNTPLTKFPLV